MSGTLLDRFLDGCTAGEMASGAPDPRALAPAMLLPLRVSRWRDAAALARSIGLRFSALWASERVDGLEVFSVLEADGRHIVLRTMVPDGQELYSLAPVYPAADRPERHAHDLLGLQLVQQPDSRRWLRHAAWSAQEYPLLRAFPAQRDPGPVPPDDRYPFAVAQGAGVVEIPVGPVHAGIIEPGHFRFLAVGETVLNLEARLGYVHKGIEKIAVGRDPAGLVRLAGRVSGDSTVAHAWAACMALERAAEIELPQRADYLRAVMLERERVANHIGDIGAICMDVGFSFGQYQLSRMREEWQRLSGKVYGHRLMMDQVVPGGVATDLSAELAAALAVQARAVAGEFRGIIERLEASESLEDRLMTTGRLAPELAAELGAIGYVGKASGQAYDVRARSPHGPYERFPITVPVYRAGDVAARARVRAEETLASLALIEQLLDALPDGPVLAPWRATAGAGEGVGMVEGWRGELISYVALDVRGRIARYYPRDPSLLNWPALELLVQGNIVPDFPVCNKSINGSYSGQDL
ncbi:MAG TPA: NADH-quinone oxidoreductase subunit C [Gammaproteobacteria bacterium]|nr:NADH-quinone oxidoreductase subunit C [Gammaproteobacteria bacterium]HRP86556.1 NADH-quinone oxidoreductase subunit C [Gammaproteobacteria bacterium]